MTKRLAGLVGVVGVVAALAFAAVQAALPGSAVGTASVSASADDPGDQEGDQESDQERDDEDSGDQGHGPPSWASNDGKGKAHGGAKGRNDAWKQLSPEARHDLMTRLVKEHEQGMRAFEACQEAGGDDCAKPLPPGLAKKL